MEANDALVRAQDDSLHVERAGKHLDLTSVVLRNAETRLNVVQELVRDQIAVAEAELALAQATLDKAREALDGATITSPMDGVVALVNVEVDDPVGDELIAISIVSTDVVEIEGVIDASGRPYVREGASAVVNIESVGDTTFGGRRQLYRQRGAHRARCYLLRRPHPSRSANRHKCANLPQRSLRRDYG